VRGEATEPPQVTELVPSSVTPDPDSPDIALISELGDCEDRVVSSTSTDLVLNQQIQLPTDNDHDSTPCPISDTVADSDWGHDEPVTSCELQRETLENI